MIDETRLRTAWLLGENGMERLAKAHVAVFGLGGVGGAAVEALARAGVGRLTLFDHDRVEESNLNRQIIATRDTVGMAKVQAARLRVETVSRVTQVTEMPVFYTPENAGVYPLEDYDYILDAIDTVSSKLELICRAQAAGVPIVSSMGTGNKLDPSRLEVADIYETSVCPLARVMRRELRRRGVERLQVVYSREEPRAPQAPSPVSGGKMPPGSVSFVPPVAGMIMAGVAVRHLAGVECALFWYIHWSDAK